MAKLRGNTSRDQPPQSRKVVSTPQPETPRGMNHIKRHMELQTSPDEPKLAWDLKANSMIEMVLQGEQLCKEHKKRWPQDVIVWDN